MTKLTMPTVIDKHLRLEQVNAMYGLYAPDKLAKTVTKIDQTDTTANIHITACCYPKRLQAELDSITSHPDNSHSDNRPHMLSIGIDEAGRGPLLGGVMVSAVLLPSALSGEFAQLSDDDNFKSSVLAGINDSKKLTAKRREQYAQAIQDIAIGHVLVDVPAAVIDTINILQASLLGMQLANDTLLNQISDGICASHDNTILKQIQIKPLVDGNRLPPLMMADSHHNNIDRKTYNQTWQQLLQTYGWLASQLCPQAIIRGDALHSSIAAASILAKVHRDQQMLELAKRYPHYLIDKHKGYPTQAHLLAIAEHGVLPEHRRSFAPIKKLLIEAK